MRAPVSSARLAILLEEEGIYERCRNYATDINDAVLKKAKEGIYPAALPLRDAYTLQFVNKGYALNSQHASAR